MVNTRATVHHVFPYDPEHLGVTIDQWWSGQLQRWPLAAVSHSRRAVDTIVHVIVGPRARLSASPPTNLRLQLHRTVYSNARHHRWGDDWSLSLGRALRAAGHNDIVVVHLEGYAAARLSLRYAHGARCVLVLHGRGIGGAQDHGASDISVILNDRSREALSGQGITVERLHSLVPSIDRELFRAERSSTATTKPPVLGYVGRLEQSKGAFELPGIVRALADLDIRLECVGSTISSATTTKATAAFAGLPIELTGELSAELVAERMRHWSALVLPSYTEGLPLVALEALSSGVPVVAVDDVLPNVLAARRGVWTGPRESMAERVRAALASNDTVDSAWIPGHAQGGESWDSIYDELPPWRPRFKPSVRLLAGRLKRMRLR